jgi:hypothetical protein
MNPNLLYNDKSKERVNLVFPIKYKAISKNDPTETISVFSSGLISDNGDLMVLFSKDTNPKQLLVLDTTVFTSRYTIEV